MILNIHGGIQYPVGEARGTPALGFDEKIDMNHDDKHEYFGDECDDKHT